jgi:methionyl-tRNA formyltransferase
VKTTAANLGIPLLQPTDLREDAFQQELRRWAADLFVVVSYGRILPLSVIEMPVLASVNVHYSLLPKLRGAAPVQRALMGGLTETGVTVQYTHEELDAGDIILQQGLAIEPTDNALTLTRRLTVVGVPLLLRALDLIAAGEVECEPQDGDAATYAPPLTRNDGLVDWCRPAHEIVNQIRGCFPWPGANCLLGGQRLKIIEAVALSAQRHKGGNCGEVVEATQEGIVVQAGSDGVLVKQLQPAGRRPMSAADFWRGARLQPGVRLEDASD